jgi:hypothetical protein
MVTNIEYCSKHIKSFHAFGTTAKEKKNELLELCVGDEKKKGPHRDCKTTGGFFRAMRKRLDNVLCRDSTLLLLVIEFV